MRAKYRDVHTEDETSLVHWSEEAKSHIDHKLRVEIETEMVMKRAMRGGTAPSSTKRRSRKHKPKQDPTPPTKEDLQKIFASRLAERELIEVNPFISRIKSPEPENPSSAEVEYLTNLLRNQFDSKHVADQLKAMDQQPRYNLAWDD